MSTCSYNLIPKFGKNLEDDFSSIPFYEDEIIEALKAGPRSNVLQAMHLVNEDWTLKVSISGSEFAVIFFNFFFFNVRPMFYIDMFMKN